MDIGQGRQWQQALYYLGQHCLVQFVTVIDDVQQTLDLFVIPNVETCFIAARVAVAVLCYTCQALST